ncbi:carbohydrate-binding module family 50 protein, partial [Sporormia fimetaria CBS 119925]
TSSSIPGAVPAPGPTQPGVAPNCNRWDVVSDGATCETFTNKYPGVTLTNLVSWNPAIGDQCGFLWLDFYVCTSVVGFTAPTKTTSTKPATTSTKTTPTPTSSVPSPVQSGINSNCKKYHKVVSGDGCYDLATKYNIALADFYRWNPSVKNDCSGLWVAYYVCVGI